MESVEVSIIKKAEVKKGNDNVIVRFFNFNDYLSFLVELANRLGKDIFDRIVDQHTDTLYNFRFKTRDYDLFVRSIKQEMIKEIIFI